MRYRARDVLLAEGGEPGHVAIIVGGVVKITASAAAGREALLGLRGAGELIGELSVLDGRPRSATARALNDVTARLVPASVFRRWLREDADAMFAVLGGLVARLRESDRKRLEFTGFSVLERVSLLLAELALTHGSPAPGGGTEIGLRLSQEEIAGATVASREAVVKALRELRGQGLVRTARQRIVVLDPARLKPLP